MFCCKKNEENIVENLVQKIEELEFKNKELKKQLYNHSSDWANDIDKFVDGWFEENKDNVDIGVINVMGLFKIDLFPDFLEKHIYKKVLKILYSFLTSALTPKN